MQKLCCICKKTVDSETSPILTVGGYGNAKYLCDECAADLDTATTARDFDVIKSAMDSIGEKMGKNNIDDDLVIATVGELFIGAKKRAKAIAAGEYDFSSEDEDSDTVTADEQTDSSEDGEEKEEFDIPEELRETDEDKELDAKEKKQGAFYDKIFNWISLGIITIALAAVVYLVFFR
jgi:hypothetical protein